MLNASVSPKQKGFRLTNFSKTFARGFNLKFSVINTSLSHSHTVKDNCVNNTQAKYVWSVGMDLHQREVIT